LYHASSWPYTSRHEITAAYDTSAEKDVKLVSTKDELNYLARTLGQKSTGMAFDVKYQYEQFPLNYRQLMQHVRNYNYMELAMEVSKLDTPEQYKLEIKYNPSQSSAQKMRMQLQWDNQESYEADEQQDHPKNTRKPTPFYSDKLDELRQELNALDSWNNAWINALRAQVKFENKQDSSRNSKYSAAIAFGSSQSSNDARLVANFQYNDIKNIKNEMNVRAKIQSPQTPQLNFNDALKQNDDLKLQVDFDFGLSNSVEKPKSVSIKGKMTQTEARRNYVDQSDEAKDCRKQMKQGNYVQAECRHATRQANVFDKYAITVDYSDFSSNVKNNARHYVDYIHQVADEYLWRYKDESKYQSKKSNGKNNQAQLTLEFEPDFEYANLTVKATTFEEAYNNIEVPENFAEWIAVHPERLPISQWAAYIVKGRKLNENNEHHQQQLWNADNEDCKLFIFI
jgi:hypothetical protein